jgi:hypothetical protein
MILDIAGGGGQLRRAQTYSPDRRTDVGNFHPGPGGAVSGPEGAILGPQLEWADLY